VLGIGLTVTAASSAFFSPAGGSAVAQSLPPTATPPAAAESFDLKKARVLYLAETGDQQIQLFVRAVVGGDAVQVTHEPSSLGGFALAPDEKTVLYEAQRTPGAMDGSSLWIVNVDGTQRRQVLDCPQSSCGGPVWSPGGQQVVYERADYVQKSLVFFSSIWRLDLKSGDTQPVFQDRQLPGSAPRFSADGRWLSYVSPSSQTLQVYEVGGDNNLSLRYRSGMPVVWSPVGDSFLFWDVTATGQLHLNVYDMTTARRNDLSGGADEIDYTAAWSPDGQWVAVTRAAQSSTAGADAQEAVWLVRPDGTQARKLLGEGRVALEDLEWSPDGRYLIYTRDAYAAGIQIRFVDVRTGQETTVVSGGSQPAWLP